MGTQAQQALLSLRVGNSCCVEAEASPCCFDVFRTSLKCHVITCPSSIFSVVFYSPVQQRRPEYLFSVLCHAPLPIPDRFLINMAGRSKFKLRIHLY